MIHHIVFDLDGVIYNTHGSQRPYHESRAVLEALARNHLLSLVTAGVVSLQWKKLRQCGFESCFQAIIIVHDASDKLAAIRGLLRTYPTIPAAKTFVVGDRVDVEIVSANHLGCKSVCVKRGKYKNLHPKNPDEHPQYTIKRLTELLEIIPTA
jgi:FMN phosphatase YigB (HAD superfamily)